MEVNAPDKSNALVATETLSHKSEGKRTTLQQERRALFYKLCPLFFSRKAHKNQSSPLTRPSSQRIWKTEKSTQSNDGHELTAWPYQTRKPHTLGNEVQGKNQSQLKDQVDPPRVLLDLSSTWVTSLQSCMQFIIYIKMITNQTLITKIISYIDF